MTRFKKEWNGELGEYWARHAREEAARLIAQRDEIEVEEDGAAKWTSSGNYLPEDVVEKLVFGGADFFSPEATAEKREHQDKAFLDEYRSRKHTPTAEELAEMRAAFGEGTTVTNVLSGEKYKL